MEEGKEKLTTKQRRFVDEYCVDFNATKAAIRAGYATRSASQIGSENLLKPVIFSTISQKLAELSMAPAEVLKRLTDIARGSFESFLGIHKEGEFEINLNLPEAKANLHLIKKIKQTKRIINVNGSTETIITNEIELHDAKDALKAILAAYQRNNGLDEGDTDVIVDIEA